MIPLFVDSVGLISAVGRSAAQTVGGITAGLQFQDELRVRDPGGEPLMGALCAIDPELEDAERLIALAVIALAECAADGVGVGRPLPLLLCCPTAKEAGFDPAAVLDGIERAGIIAVDRERSRLFTGGHSGVVDALLVAERMLASREVDSCVVGGVDALCSHGRLRAAIAEKRLKTSLSPDGFVGGEGAAFLRVSGKPAREGSASIRGISKSAEPRPAPGAAPAPPTGALGSAAIEALASAGFTMKDVSHVLHDASGERAAAHELALTITRLAPRSKPPAEVLTLAPSLGELGAATGAVASAIAATCLSKSVWSGPAALLLLRDHGEARGGVVMAGRHG